MSRRKQKTTVKKKDVFCIADTPREEHADCSKEILKKNFMELLPLFSLANSYIQIALNTLLSILLLTNTGFLFAIINSNIKEKTSMINLFTVFFIVSLFSYGFSLEILFKIKKIIVEHIESKKVDFECTYTESRSEYSSYFKFSMFVLFISFSTFIIGIYKLS